MRSVRCCYLAKGWKLFMCYASEGYSSKRFTYRIFINWLLDLFVTSFLWFIFQLIQDTKCKEENYNFLFTNLWSNRSTWVTQIWPAFFKFLVSPKNFVLFGQIMDLAKDLAWQKIFSGRSTNLKIEKSSFFCPLFFTPYFISFPDTQWDYKITTDNINIRWLLNG